MSIAVMSYVWEHSSRKGTELLLLLAIADFANKQGTAFPAVATLADRIRMSPRNTQRVVSKLVASGELAIDANAGPNGTHLFRILINETLPLFAHPLGDDKLSPDKLTGDTRGPGGVTNRAKGGDTAMSPEPFEPSTKPSSTPAKAGKWKNGEQQISDPTKFQITDQLRAWAKKHGWEPYLEAHHEHFIDYVAQPKNANRYADLDAAFRTCVRVDWGDIRRNLIRSGVTPERQEDTRCQERLGPDMPCGMPGKDRGGKIYRCDHHQQKHEQARAQPMSAATRQALDALVKNKRMPTAERET